MKVTLQGEGGEGRRSNSVRVTSCGHMGCGQCQGRRVGGGGGGGSVCVMRSLVWFYFLSREDMLCCRTGIEMAQIFKSGNEHYK